MRVITLRDEDTNKALLDRQRIQIILTKLSIRDTLMNRFKREEFWEIPITILTQSTSDFIGPPKTC